MRGSGAKPTEPRAGSDFTGKSSKVPPPREAPARGWAARRRPGVANPAVPLTPADAGHLPALGGQSSPRHTLVWGVQTQQRPSSPPPAPRRLSLDLCLTRASPGLPLGPCFCYLTRQFCHRIHKVVWGMALTVDSFLAFPPRCIPVPPQVPTARRRSARTEQWL